MGKGRRNNEQHKKNAGRTSRASTVKRRQHSQSVRSATAAGNATPKQNGNQHQQRKTRFPFHQSDNVLLVGEGDFSFALSLAKQNSVSAVVATSYDDLAKLEEKYPNIAATLSGFTRQATEGREEESQASTADDEWKGFYSGNSAEDQTPLRAGPRTTIFYGIDAKALSTKHKKAIGKHGPFTKIIFNFPHTGGLSTDVNRQVRANQDLLVGFFNSAKALLATARTPARLIEQTEEDDTEDWDPEEAERLRQETRTALATGRILVSLFEGEPYTLWNIRDLARHCGLQVIESFSFPWDTFPDYKHARTIGEITTGRDRSEEGKRKGAWRGEERAARCFVLGMKEETAQQHSLAKKRKNQHDSDESD